MIRGVKIKRERSKVKQRESTSLMGVFVRVLMAVRRAWEGEGGEGTCLACET